MRQSAPARLYRLGAGRAVVLGALLLSVGSVHAGILDMSWTAPTTEADGSPLIDLASYRIYYGTSSAPCPGPAFVPIASPTASPPPDQTINARLTGLVTDTRYYVAVSAVAAAGTESACTAPQSALARVDFSVGPSGLVNFGTVNVGGRLDQSFTVQNTGGGTVAGSVSTSFADFTVVSGSPFSLAGAGATQTVVVRFSPTIVAAETANVNFTAGGGSISRTVTGTGTMIDTMAPTVAITSPTTTGTYTTATSSLSLAGTAADNRGMSQVTWANSRGGSGAAIGTTSWTVSGIALQLGTNVVTVTAQDTAGNTGTATLTVNLSDSTPPTVDILSYTRTAHHVVTLHGTASDKVGVRVVTWSNNRGGSGTAIGTTSWTASGVRLQPGWNVLTVTAVDGAGNTAATTVTLRGQDF